MLTTYTDTVLLFREKTVDFMIPSKEKKVQGLDKSHDCWQARRTTIFKLRRTRQREQLLRGTFLVCRLGGTVPKA